VKTPEKSEGAQRCLLDYIFGISAISKHPSSQVGGAVQMRQHQLLKPNSVLWL